MTRIILGVVIVAALAALIIELTDGKEWDELCKNSTEYQELCPKK